MQTYRNLRYRPMASLCVWQQTPPYIAYKVNGTVVIHDNDAVSAALDKHVWAGHDRKFAERRKGWLRFSSRSRK